MLKTDRLNLKNCAQLTDKEAIKRFQRFTSTRQHVQTLDSGVPVLLVIPPALQRTPLDLLIKCLIYFAIRIFARCMYLFKELWEQFDLPM